MQRISLLDYGRFIAIIGVLIFHYFSNGIQVGRISSVTHISGFADIAKYCYLGVEFFFIISGYVIFFSAQNRTSGQFAVARATRLYPAYFVAVIFTSIFSMLWEKELMWDRGLGIPGILANLTMVAPAFGYDFVDGVYWSLVYELQFYFLVFLLLFLGLDKKLEAIFMFWPIAILIGRILNINHMPHILGNYYCFFAAGVMFAMMQREITLKKSLLLGLCLFLCIDFSITNAAALSAAKGYYLSPVVITVLIAAFFMFFLAVNTKIGQNIQLSGSRLLGGITYPLYLIHGYFGYMLLQKFGTEDNKIYIYSFIIITVFIIAFLIHTLVEKRYSQLWKNLFHNYMGEPIDKLNEVMSRKVKAIYSIVASI